MECLTPKQNESEESVMTKMTKKQMRKLVAQIVLVLIGLVGFFLILNSIGTLDGDFITISTQLSLNVRVCITGFALIALALNVYRVLFKD